MAKHWSLAHLGLLAALVSVPCLGQSQSTFVQLQPKRHLRKGVDAWPLIANPQTPAEARINAELIKRNASLASAIRECDQEVIEFYRKDGSSSREEKDTLGDWSRKVEVTMTGPRILSMVATDGWYCGGVHPDWDRTALLFDLETGHSAKWSDLLTTRKGWSLYTDNTPVGTNAEGIILPQLKTLSIENAVTECKDAFNPSQAYLIWPDASKGMLVAWPWDMPHAAQACAENLPLSLTQARSLGFSEDFLQAILQAHKQFLAAHANSVLKPPR